MAYKGLSVAYSLQGDLDKAEQALQDGLKQVTDTRPLQLALAGLFADQGQNDRAEALYKELINKDSTYLPAYQAYTSFLLTRNKPETAMTVLEQAVSGSSDHRLYTLLALSCLEAGDTEKALVAVQRSLSLNPNQSVSYTLLEEMYRNSWADLIALGNQYISQGQAAAGEVLKITALYHLGQYDDLIKYYEQLSNDVKDNAKMGLLVARAYTARGKSGEGLKLVRGIEIGTVQDAVLLAEIAGYFFDAGDKDRARESALAGMGLDDSVLDNYVIMYRSYVDEDVVEANVWLAKFVLSSHLGPSASMRELSNNGLTLSREDAKEAVSDSERKWLFVFTQEDVDKVRNRDNSHSLYLTHRKAYFDQVRKVLYYSIVITGDKGLEFDIETTSGTVSFKGGKELVLKPVILRISNPKLYSSDVISKEQRVSDPDKWYSEFGNSQVFFFDKHIPVAIELISSPFEDRLIEAGYDIPSFVFVDIK